MAEKRVIEYEAASELANDDWLLIDGVTEGTRKARPNVVTAELGTQVTNLASTVGGLTQVAMGHEQSFAPSYDEDTSYDVDDLVMQYNCLYRCTAPTTGTWDAGKWARTEVSEQLEESGKIDDVQVNGVSVVTDKVANIDLTDMQSDIDSKVADVTIGGESIVNEDHVFEMDNFIAKASIPSGAIATITDGVALPMPSLKVGIEAQQAGTGDPSPTNVRPISGWDEVNVYRTGINVWNEEWENGYWSRGIYVSASSICCKNKIPVKPNTSYYIKVPSGNYFYYTYYDKGKNYIDLPEYDSQGRLKIYESGTITIPDNVYYMTWNMASTYGTTYNNDISINYPSTDTSYHAYNGQTYTTALKDGQGNPMTCYGGELSNENGVQTLDNLTKKIVFNDDLWVVSSGNVYLSIPDSGEGDIICDILQNGTTIGKASIVPANSRLYVWDAVETYNITTREEAQAFFNGHELVYHLATPTTIPQDNLAISSQEGTNNIWADSGDVIEGSYYRNVGTTLTDLIARVEALENE